MVISSLTVEINSNMSAYAGLKISSSNVGGVISENTTWSLENSPYVFIDDVTVASGVTLTIDPSVTVDFAFWSLTIKGTLYAKGNETNRIKFESSEGPLFGYPRIFFQEGSDGIIEFSEFSVIQPPQGIIVGGSPKISNNLMNLVMRDGPAISIDGGIVSNNTINGGYMAIIANNASILCNVIRGAKWGIVTGHMAGYGIYSPIIMGNLIMNTTVGINVFDSPVVSNNTIVNTAKGILFPSYSFYDGATPRIIYNNFYDNDFNVVVEKKDPRITINMTHNWWGTTNSIVIDQKIHDQNDDNRLSLVNYSPFLTSVAIPEFPSFLIPTLFMTATLLAAILHRRKSKDLVLSRA